MVVFKDLGFSLDLDDEWTKTDSVLAEIKPYLYEGFKKDDAYCYVLQYGRGRLEELPLFIEWVSNLDSNISLNLIAESRGAKVIDNVEQEYYEKLSYDKNKQVYNYKFFTNFSKAIGVWGCLDFYFTDKEDLNEIKTLIDEKFKYLGD